jgi:hypothetical protein
MEPFGDALRQVGNGRSAVSARLRSGSQRMARGMFPRARVVAGWALGLSLGACADLPVTPHVDSARPDPEASAPSLFPAEGVGVTHIEAASGRVYTAHDALAVKALVYGDRLSSYEEVPTLVQGQVYIRTRANDQAVTGSNSFLSFRIDRPATVYVAYNGSPPSWLTSGGFVATGDSLVVVRDTDRRPVTFHLHAKIFPAGSVTLGSNREGASTASMYTVILRPLEPAASALDFNVVIRGVRPRGFGQGGYTLAQPAAGGVMYWVSTTGNDTNAGTSSAPFRTINRAARLARAGDVVTIRNGSYDESVAVRNSGTPGSRIVFQAENRGGVVLGGSNDKVFQPHLWNGEQGATGPGWVTLRGLIFRDYGNQLLPSGNAVRTGRGWRIEDCLFERSANTGLNVADDDVEVIRTTFKDHALHAFLVGTKDVGATSASDPLFQPLLGIRILDTVLRGNHTIAFEQAIGAATRVAKVMMTRGLVIDNMESFENRGAGMWLDSRNVDYTIRNSYFHSNRGFTTTAGVYRAEVARGLYLEKNWGGGVVENNVMMNNEASGLHVVNSAGLLVRHNLFVRNDRCVLLSNLTSSNFSYDMFAFGDIHIEHNQCKNWARTSAIHYPGGPVTTPARLNVVVDNNIYEPGRNRVLAWWSSLGSAPTIADMQRVFGWERNGRVGVIPW